MPTESLKFWVWPPKDSKIALKMTLKLHLEPHFFRMCQTLISWDPPMVLHDFHSSTGPRIHRKIVQKSDMQLKYQKHQIIQVHGCKIVKKGRRKWGGEGSGNSHFSDLEAFRLHFWSQAALGRPIKWKWSPNDPQIYRKLVPSDINLNPTWRYGNKLKLTSITKRSHTSWKLSGKCSWRHGGGVCAQRYLDMNWMNK